MGFLTHGGFTQQLHNLISWTTDFDYFKKADKDVDVSERVPPFSLVKPRYDMENFGGRLSYFADATNPRRMFHSRRTIENAVKELKNYELMLEDVKTKKGEPVSLTTSGTAALWEARAIKEACVHPATGDHLFPLFRFAAFAPVNWVIVPLCVHPMVVSSQFWGMTIHWLNQSYNVCVNYNNRASDAVPVRPLLEAYAAAVAVSVGGALVAAAIMKRIPNATGDSLRGGLIRAFLPYLFVASAGGANVGLTRQKEFFQDGIEVKDEQGNLLGKSVLAGHNAYKYCAVTRFLWNLPSMVFPPLVALGLSRAFPKYLRGGRNKLRRTVLECFACMVGISGGVPPALAAFPPTLRMAIDDLEPEFQKFKQEGVKTVSFYKGL